MLKTAPLYKAEGSLIGAIACLKDTSKTEDVNSNIKHSGSHDLLTGFLGRAQFEKELKKHDNDKGLPLSVIRAEINGLKLVNETFGYHHGDNLIIQGAMVIRNTCGNNASIFRWDGIGFTILLPKTDYETSLRICKRVINTCKETNNTPIPLSLACGTATKNNITEDINKAVKKADIIMQRKKTLASKELQVYLTNSLQKLLEAKADETVEHAFRINNYAAAIGMAVGLSADELHKLALLSALHDIGKIAIPDSIILKVGNLSPEEWEIMMMHSEIGYNITRSVPELSSISKEVLYHHEWWNGQGYPVGLAGENIPLLSRIIAVVDAYDVMTSGRSYKKPVSPKKALSELRKYSGSHFEPRLVETFINIQTIKNSTAH